MSVETVADAPSGADAEDSSSDGSADLGTEAATADAVEAGTLEAEPADETEHTGEDAEDTPAS